MIEETNAHLVIVLTYVSYLHDRHILGWNMDEELYPVCDDTRHARPVRCGKVRRRFYVYRPMGPLLYILTLSLTG